MPNNRVSVRITGPDSWHEDPDAEVREPIILPPLTQVDYVDYLASERGLGTHPARLALADGIGLDPDNFAERQTFFLPDQPLALAAHASRLLLHSPTISRPPPPAIDGPLPFPPPAASGSQPFPSSAISRPLPSLPTATNGLLPYRDTRGWQPFPPPATSRPLPSPPPAISRPLPLPPYLDLRRAYDAPPRVVPSRGRSAEGRGRQYPLQRGSPVDDPEVIARRERSYSPHH
ncbi:hypothetical protein F4677DRAFT_375999 [Hypoxylon crocopeplum]|nr:hypothetical protein F4677DRAFT_375999 [Hypoxylon crocopeplum]